MVEKYSNKKTIRVTAQDGVTGRTRFEDFASESGLINHPAFAIKIRSAEAQGGNNAYYDMNLRTGDIDTTNAEEILPGATETFDGEFHDVEYEGNGGAVVLVITIQW